MVYIREVACLSVTLAHQDMSIEWISYDSQGSWEQVLLITLTSGYIVDREARSFFMVEKAFCAHNK